MFEIDFNGKNTQTHIYVYVYWLLNYCSMCDVYWIKLPSFLITATTCSVCYKNCVSKNSVKRKKIDNLK